jgi:parvulin-like peptidyl-prolyl isomerase
MVVFSLAGAVRADVVAVVNGKAISNADFNAEMREEAGHQVLTAMIETQIIQDAYNKAGLPLLDSDVNSYIAQHFGSVDNFRQAAKQNGVDPDSYIQRAVKPQIMLERLAVKYAPATAENLQKFFTDHKANYSVAETVTVRQIVVNTKADADKAEAALKAGTDFAQVAKDDSVDPNAKQSGGLIEQPVPVTDLPPPLDAAVKGLQEGKYSDPVSVQQVFVIFKLEKRTPGQDKTFDQVRDQVQKDYLAKQTGRDSLTALRDRLRAEAIVHVNDAQFKAIESELKKPLAPPPGAPGGSQGPPEGAPGQTGQE